MADCLSLGTNIWSKSFETLNPFVSNTLFLYPIKTSENLMVLWWFQGGRERVHREQMFFQFRQPKLNAIIFFYITLNRFSNFGNFLSWSMARQCPTIHVREFCFLHNLHFTLALSGTESNHWSKFGSVNVSEKNWSFFH